ncbi:MAG: response regulator [Desulfobacterales bacterium]|nr:response regulator [Desulfobacterales bacterium]MBF0397506.1 response regulator [Desulfobacterales bacterium]
MSVDKPLVLIVDDNSTNIDVLVNTLKHDYRLGVAKSGTKALEYASKYIPDLILLDIMMPEMNGYEVCANLKSSTHTQGIAIIFLTAMSDASNKTKGFELGAVDYITKPFHVAEVKARVQTHLSLKKMKEEVNAQNLILEERIQEKTAQIQEMLKATIQAMALIGETRDPYTAGHQQRVAKFACDVAHIMGLSENQITTINFAGILHDIGKIRIPVSILNRPGKLLYAEFDLIKVHSETSYELLKNIPSPWPFAKIALQHHERLDGSGYPHKLKGDEILIESRILAVADVIEAMSSHRPYRPALGIETALEEIQKNRGKFFDPDVVDAFINYFSK